MVAVLFAVNFQLRLRHKRTFSAVSQQGPCSAFASDVGPITGCGTISPEQMIDTSKMANGNYDICLIDCGGCDA